MKISIHFSGLDIRTETKAEYDALCAIIQILRNADLFEGAGKVCQQFLKNSVSDHQIDPSASVAIE